MMKKRMLGVIAVLLVCIFALSACKKEAGKPVDNAVSENTTDDSEDTDQTEDAGKYKFGFSVIDMQNPYFITLEEAAQQIVEKEECTMLVKDPASDADTQAEQIREMINEGINAIFLCPVDWEKITPSLQALQDAGVKIINIDSQVKDTDYIDAYVGSDNTEAGKLCGNDLIEKYPDGGTVAILEATTQNSVNDRITGFEQAVAKAEKGFEVVAREDTNGTFDSALEAAKKILEEQPDVTVLFKEVQSIIDQGVPMPKILVSDRAQMVMSYHKNFDAYEEERLGGKSFGSTKSGIAPFYSDKYAKIGFQVSELFDDELLKEKVVRVAEQKNVLLEHLYHKPLINPDDLYNELQEYKKMVEPFVCDTSLFLNNALKEGKEVLLEGQLGSLKDPDHGIYPMVTSSSTLAGYGAIGAGIPPYEIKKIVTVCKAYSSAVGAGAFVSEIFGDEADELRRRGGDGGEFGATTGRPRRMGWFDCVASKYGCRMQGATDVAFTVLDVLGYLDEIPVCVGYDIDGEVTTEFPTTHLLEKAKPVLKKLPGWKCDIRGIKKYEDLPENCRKYIEFVEEQIGYPITMVSNGPERHDIIYRESKLSK